MKCNGPCPVCDSVRRQTERPPCVGCDAPADIRELGSGEARCWDCFQAWSAERAADLRVFVPERRVLPPKISALIDRLAT